MSDMVLSIFILFNANRGPVRTFHVMDFYYNAHFLGRESEVQGG